MNYYYILIGLLSFLFGFILAYLIFHKKSSDTMLYATLNDFKKSIDEYKNQTMLHTNEINNAIKTASNLTKVLTTNQNLKGQFGEDCLETILKTCFPNENINYIKQIKTHNDMNQEIKPDFLVNLPNNKSILIDCKLNLEKYIEYKENELNKEKKNEFIKDLNTTINLLANKKYETAVDINQPDFILMYIPLEPILTLIYTDNDFLSVVKNANERNIIIVGNSSILTTIKLTKLLWAQHVQNENMEKIINIAQNIYEYISIHAQNIYNFKKTLDENNEIINREYEKFCKNNKFFKLTQELRNCGIQATSKKQGKKLNEIKIHDNFLQ
ncbi:DNA recombination protein RmuC [bacterium]|nr:DNA recombination protein RmuC [bacterium]